MQFRFNKNIWYKNLANKIYLGILDHNKELIDRIIQLVLFLVALVGVCLFYIKDLTQLVQKIVPNVKFFQPSPQEYFLLSFTIAVSLALIIETPFIILSILSYLFPALFGKEKMIIIGLIVFSFLLFISGSIFAAKIVIPTALKFFFAYTEDVLEPLWSFREYIDFIWLAYIGCFFSFQLPFFQFLLGFTGLCTTRFCFESFRYLLLISTILGAILTPSTDPLTQLLFSLAIIILYCIGSLGLFTLEKLKILN